MSNYRHWLERQGKEVDIESVMKNVWDWINGSYHDSVEIIYYVLLYFRLIKLPQFRMLEDVIRKAETGSLEEVYLSLASELLIRMQASREKLAEFQSTHEPAAFGKYLYRTLRYVCIYSVAKIIRTYYDPNRISIAADGGTSGKSISFNPSTSRTRQPVEEIIINIAIQKEARGIAEQIMQNWDETERNALCHLMDTISGRESGRLREVNRTYIYQIHHRIKEKLLQMILDRDTEREVIRAFCGIYRQEICQKTPVLSTYKGRGES